MTEQDRLQNEKLLTSFLYQTVGVLSVLVRRGGPELCSVVPVCCHCPLLFVRRPLLHVGGRATFTARDAADQSLLQAEQTSCFTVFTRETSNNSLPVSKQVAVVILNYAFNFPEILPGVRAFTRLQSLEMISVP